MAKKYISLREFKEQYGREELRLLAESLGTSLEYFDRLAKGVRKPKVGKGKLMERIIEARPKLFSKESLRPDVFA